MTPDQRHTFLTKLVWGKATAPVVVQASWVRMNQSMRDYTAYWYWYLRDVNIADIVNAPPVKPTNMEVNDATRTTTAIGATRNDG